MGSGMMPVLKSFGLVAMRAVNTCTLPLVLYTCIMHDMFIDVRQKEKSRFVFEATAKGEPRTQKFMCVRTTTSDASIQTSEDGGGANIEDVKDRITGFASPFFDEILIGTKSNQAKAVRTTIGAKSNRAKAKETQKTQK